MTNYVRPSPEVIPLSAHPKFEYKRMAIGASGDGEFISKYEDVTTENDDKSKRSVKDGTEEEAKVVLPVKVTKRSTSKSKKVHKRDNTATATKGVARGPQGLDAEVLIAFL